MPKKKKTPSVRSVNDEVTPFVNPETGRLFKPQEGESLYIKDENGRLIPAKDDQIK